MDNLVLLSEVTESNHHPSFFDPQVRRQEGYKLWLSRGEYIPWPASSTSGPSQRDEDEEGGDLVREITRVEKSLDVLKEIAETLPSNPVELRLIQLYGMVEWVLTPCKVIPPDLILDRLLKICWNRGMSLSVRSENVRNLREELEAYVNAKKLEEAEKERKDVILAQQKEKEKEKLGLVAGRAGGWPGLRAFLPVLTLGSGSGKGKARARTYETHDVYKAIDDKDIMTLMAIRDINFGLLLTKSPGVGSVFPIVYAMRCGPKWEDVTILLVGALSRWVNHLDDTEEPSVDQKNIIKTLRINLKAAIDFGLQSHQTNLISSYLQVLIMSEGEKFLSKSMSDISLALRAGPPERPVELAGEMVRKFATKDLRGVDGLSAVEDYIANATADLIILSLHSLLIPSDPLPTYAFARDIRLLQLFTDSTDRHPSFNRMGSPRLRRTAGVVRDVWGNGKESFQSRVKTLKGLIDGENGLK
ncbi:hypothetical protein [Phaffia rhodozyma]|uniref:Uncharacterized protein n=1 Tax=Phaffia rhodozyma TaxID=264483 RepID=A0A0F7SK18_PHARH|nr:hypothetical protein [Phaffia rhodozyma]